MPRERLKRFTRRLSDWSRHCCKETYRSNYIFSKRCWRFCASKCSGSSSSALVSWGFRSSICLFSQLAFPYLNNVLISLPRIYIVICQCISYLDEFHFLTVAFKDGSSTFIASHLSKF